MNDQLEKIKKFAFQLSKLINKQFASSSRDKLTIYASDLNSDYSCKKLVKKFGFSSIYQGLHKILENNLQDYIPELKVEHQNFNGTDKSIKKWKFYPIKKNKKIQIKDASVSRIRDFTLTIYQNNDLFEDHEIQFLQSYSKQIENLIKGKCTAKTSKQEIFKQVGLDLLNNAANKATPKDFFSKTLAKYIIHTTYLQEDNKT